MNEGPVVLSSLWNGFFFPSRKPHSQRRPFLTHGSMYTSVYPLTVSHSTWNQAHYSLLNSSSLYPVTDQNTTIFLVPSPVVLPHFLLSSFLYWSQVQSFLLFHLALPRIWPLPLFCQISYPNRVPLCLTSRSSFSLALTWTLSQDNTQRIS